LVLIGIDEGKRTKKPFQPGLGEKTFPGKFKSGAVTGLLVEYKNRNYAFQIRGFCTKSWLIEQLRKLDSNL